MRRFFQGVFLTVNAIFTSTNHDGLVYSLMSSSSHIKQLNKLNNRLRHVQTYSGVAFGSFALLHSVPALLATAGALDAIDDIVMIERCAYHFPYVEVTWVFGSVTLHVLAGVARRLVLRTLSRSETTQKQLYTSNAQQKAGFALIPLLISHTLLNRIIPSTTAPPINSLSPSELSYSHYVGYLLNTGAVMKFVSGFSLISLSAITTYHGISGLRRGKKGGKVALKCSLVNAVSVLVGLVNLARGYESVSYLEPRYEAVYGYFKVF